MTLHEAYEVLGLPTDATAAQVKAAYRRLVAQAHPDRGGKTTVFIRIRAAYEIVSASLQQGTAEDEIPIPPDLRDIIDSVVSDFREQQRWAEAQTLTHLSSFHKNMNSYIQKASRADLRRFSVTFSTAWDATVAALFEKCNSQCDLVMRRYETWYADHTQEFLDGLYRKDLLRFAVRRRFWEAFAILGAIAGALSAVVGWEGPWRHWVSVAMILAAVGLAFGIHWWTAKRRRILRQRVEPLSVVVFELDKNARFTTETSLRRGRFTTAALGLAGLFLGNAASAGLAMPAVGALAGAALGGALDRFLNPIDQVRSSMQRDLRRFVTVAQTQMTAYVREAHAELLDDVRTQITENYRERMQETVKLLTAADDRLHA